VDQIDDLEAAGPYQGRVLIVDNDPDGGAAEVVGRVTDPRVTYVHEPAPGLSAVRNRALDSVDDARLVAFMDDDGRPAAGWLVGLVMTWDGHDRPSAVAGRVLEEYEVPPDPWIAAGGFFRRRSLPTGTVVPVAPAGNLLVDVEDVRSRGIRFDPRFGLTGGEDTLFTSQLTASGGRIVWCDEARVVDLVPADRMTRRWVLARAHSHGNTRALVAQAMASGGAARWVTRCRGVLGGVARIAGGRLRWALGLLTRSQRHQAVGLRTAAKGAGMVSGSLGRVVQEYGR
jgi:succinoglycan biosynthesis protein ExoM